MNVSTVLKVGRKADRRILENLHRVLDERSEYKSAVVLRILEQHTVLRLLMRYCIIDAESAG